MIDHLGAQWSQSGRDLRRKGAAVGAVDENVEIVRDPPVSEDIANRSAVYENLPAEDRAQSVQNLTGPREPGYQGIYLLFAHMAHRSAFVTSGDRKTPYILMSRDGLGERQPEAFDTGT
jgi:hypothetical protein